MLLTKIAVEPEIGLILIVRFVGGAHEVVRSCHVRKRIVLENFCADRIESLRWYRIVLELGAGWRGRVENRLRKDTLTLGNRRHHTEPGHPRPQSRALPVSKKECLIGLDGAPERPSINITAELRLGTGLCKEIPGVESFVPKELKDA